MKKWWDLNNDENENKTEYLARVKYDEIICEKVNSFKQIFSFDLKENVQYRLITNTSFNAISVLEYVNQNFQINEIYIAVYRMNQQSVRKIIELIDLENIQCKIILSSFFRDNKKYEKWCNNLISYAESKNNIDISFAWNHAKVFIAKTTCGKHLVFEGSGNLSDNARIEQYILENNKTTYLFHKKWINEILKNQ